MTTINIRIQKYDDKIKSPPFEFITIDQAELQVRSDEQDLLGQDRWHRIRQHCQDKGYVARFYSLSNSKKYHFDVTVK